MPPGAGYLSYATAYAVANNTFIGLVKAYFPYFLDQPNGRGGSWFSRILKVTGYNYNLKV